MHLLKDLEPRKVFHYFEELTKIPRGSGEEKAVSDYLKQFALDRGLSVIQDEILNIVIKKPGTPGYENSPPVILQGHMDMVNEKNKGTVHDFSKDPLKLRVEGDSLYAEGTTLGADNGIAVAYALAILDSDDLSHPPLEVLVTVEEETGMGGAAAIDGRHFHGKALINIDSEEEGTFLVSCAGGARETVRLPLGKASVFGQGFRLEVKGLRGGHSGIEIHKGRGNANKLLGRVLHRLRSQAALHVGEIAGGAKSNAIPREAEVLLVLTDGDKDNLIEAVSALNAEILEEIRTQDEGFHLELSELPGTAFEAYDADTTQKAIDLLLLLPDGVESYSQDIPGLVQTSLNLGVLYEEDGELCYDFAVRSSVNSQKEALMERIRLLAQRLGAQAVIASSYPAWKYNRDSKLRDTFIRVYEEKYGVSPKIEAIHAGLECGILSDRIPGADMISLGPNLYDVHTPDEHMSLSSVKNVYEFLLDVLKALK